MPDNEGFNELILDGWENKKINRETERVLIHLMTEINHLGGRIALLEERVKELEER